MLGLLLGITTLIVIVVLLLVFTITKGTQALKTLEHEKRFTKDLMRFNRIEKPQLEDVIHMWAYYTNLLGKIFIILAVFWLLLIFIRVFG